MGIHRYLKKLTTKQTQSARIGAPSKPPTRNLVSWLTTHYKLALFIILPLGLFLPLRLLVQLPGFDYLVTTSSKLGSFMPFAILVGLLITAATSYFIIDYHLHRKPLRDEQPKIAYTPLHHIKVVSLPLVKYRWRSVSYWIFVGTTSLVVLSYLLGVSMVGLAAPGSLTVTINQKSGTSDPNPSYTSVFTVQFSEPIDEATLTNSDITLGGTAPGQQVQSITEAGTFNKTTYEVRIQASSAGTIQPTIAQELITAQNGASGTNQASTSTDNSVTYDGTWAQNEFIIRVKTDNPGSSGSNEFIIPIDGYFATGIDIDCDNDGIVEFADKTGGPITCTYSSAGEYDVSIVGTEIGIRHQDPVNLDPVKILDLKQWGNAEVTRASEMLKGASNLQISAIDAPNFASSVTYMTSIFYGATNFNSNINHWDVSNIEDMSYTFREATAFNQPLNNWNVNSVTNMEGMFLQATSFNGLISAWNVDSVTSMRYMFDRASTFNQPIGSWDTSSVSDMSAMFHQTPFNQPIGNWNTSNVTDMSNTFALNTAFNQPLNNWQTDSVVNMSQMFAGSAFNQPLNSWHVHNVTNMSAMFAGSSFNQSLASWNVSSVTSMSMMFGDAGGNLPNSSSLSITNYDSTLASWSSQSLQSGVTFDAGTSKYCNSETQRQSIITNHSWTITDGGKDCSSIGSTEFITTWKTDNPGVSGSNQITVPTFSGETYNYNVDWGDSTTSSNQTGNSTHTYSTPGTYTVKITGTFPRIYFSGTTDHDKILTVEQWGTNPWTSMNGAFSGATNLTISATDTPNLSGVTDMSFMFQAATSVNQSLNNWSVDGVQNMMGAFMSATSFNQPLSNWDVSNVTDMTGMFYGATSFNQSLDNWDTGNVVTMGYMFLSATSFNAPIGGWDTSSVTDMSSMFRDAVAFNQTLNGWDTSNVTSMNSMFSGGTAFNQPLSNWNVSSVTNMGGMFAGAASFNQPLSNWNVSSVTDMEHMFFDAIIFNQPLNNWDVSSVVSMGWMFASYTGGSFNQPLDSWNVSSVTNMNGMFGLAIDFNQPLNNWNVSSATGMNGMFAGAASFNQPLSNWNVSNVTNMNGMFGGAASFNQPLATWNVSSVTDMDDMFLDAALVVTPGVTYDPSGLSTANYDSTLASWSSQSLQSGVTFDAGTSKYCNSETQRQSIIDNYTWTINDAGKDCSIQPPENLVGTPHTKSIEVDWDDVTGANHYKLEYKPTSSSTWTEYTNNTISGSFLEITGLEASTSYDIRVKAVDSSNDESDWSDTLTISTLAQQTYHISDCKELQSIYVNPDTYVVGDSGGRYLLDNDIDCSETSGWYWEGVNPEANIPSGFLAMVFSGDFDGQGHMINNIYQDTEYLTVGGMFAQINGASISNVTLNNFNRKIGAKEAFTITLPTGGVVVTYALSSTISNVEVKNLQATGESVGKLGGIVGTADSSTQIIKSSVTGSVNLSGYTLDGRFDQPLDITNDNSGNVYILDVGNKRVQKFDSNGNYIMQFKAQDNSATYTPSSIAIDSSGFIYITDQTNRFVRKYDNNGIFQSQFGSSGSGDGQFHELNDIAVDSMNNILVADRVNSRVQKFDSNGSYISQFGSSGSGDGQFYDLSKLVLDSTGNIYTLESNNHRVQKFDTNGNFLQKFDTDTFADESFNTPVSLSIDSLGNIYITDSGTLKIRKFTNSGSYISDIGTETEVFAPYGILVNTSGDIVVSDIMRNSITRYSNTGVKQNSWGRYGSNTGADLFVGGVAGLLVNSSIRESFTNISITVDINSGMNYDDGSAVAPLVALGYYSNINDSYSLGSIATNGGPVITAGIAGWMYTTASINNSYSATDITETNNILPESFGSPWPSDFSASSALVGMYVMPDVVINNSFFAGSLQSNIPIRSLVSMAMTGNPTGPLPNTINVYYDQTKSGVNKCIGLPIDMNTSSFLPPIDSDCHPINTDGSQPNYFKNNSTNPPLNQWNFSTIWKTNCTNYPNFVGSSGCTPSTPSPSPTPTPTSSPTSTPTPTPTSSPTPTVSPTPTTSTNPNVSPPASGSGGGSTRPTTKTSPKPSGPGLASDQVGFFSKGGPLWSFAVVTAPGLPFMFSSLLLLIALAYAVQSWREYRFERSIQALIDRYQATDQDIHDFISITAHYLNTPVAILQNALDLLQSQKLVTALTYASLSDQLKDLGQFASGLQHATQESLADTQAVTANTMPDSHKGKTELSILVALKDRPVWISLLAVAIIIAGADITLTLTGAYTVSGLRAVNQLAFFILCLILILVSGYLYHKHKAGRQKQADLLQKVRNLHQTKQAFLDESSQKLQDYIDFLTINSSELQAHSDQSKLYLNGLAMLTELGGALGFVTTHAGAVNTATSSLVAPAIQAVLPGLQQQAQVRNITLEVDTPSALAARAEPEHIGKLTEILVGNAIKFTPEGGKVSLRVKAAGQHVTLVVTDAGPGLSDSARQHLFEPFSRGTSTETYDSQGLGMGLYNAQFLVRSLGGIIKLQAARPIGTVVTITLPGSKLAKLPG